MLLENPVESTLSKTLAPIGLALYRGNWLSVAQSVISCKEMRKLVIDVLLKRVTAECEILCSTSSKSKLQLSKPADLMAFSWIAVAQELKQKAPTFFGFLSAVISRHRQRNRHKGITEESCFPALCTAAAILLKQRCEKMNSLQHLIGTILFHGNASKQVLYAIHVIYNIEN